MHGVELFFVISGFCLAYPILVGFGTGGTFNFDLRQYTAKRLVRIFPPYLAALAILIALAAVPAWHGPVTDAHVSAASFSALDIAKEVVLLDGGPLHNKSFWSLAIELRWYAIFPLAIALFLRAPQALWLLCPVLWLLYYQSTAAAADLLALPAFFLGIIAADAYINQPRWIRYAPYVLLAGGSLGLAFATFSRFPYWQIAAFGVVLCAIWSEQFRKALSYRPLTFIGISSYSIYLVHEPVIVWAEARGASALLAGVIAVGCGISFWAIVERVVMQRETHRRAVALVSDLIGRGWALLTAHGADAPPKHDEDAEGATVTPPLVGAH